MHDKQKINHLRKLANYEGDKKKWMIMFKSEPS